MAQNKFLMWIVAVVALIVSAGAGYAAGVSHGIERGVAQEKIAEVARRAQAEREAAKAVNPFNQNANPLGNASANPFENVKVNPFK